MAASTLLDMPLEIFSYILSVYPKVMFDFNHLVRLSKTCRTLRLWVLTIGPPEYTELRRLACKMCLLSSLPSLADGRASLEPVPDSLLRSNPKARRTYLETARSDLRCQKPFTDQFINLLALVSFEDEPLVHESLRNESYQALAIMNERLWYKFEWERGYHIHEGHLRLDNGHEHLFRGRSIDPDDSDDSGFEVELHFGFGLRHLVPANCSRMHHQDGDVV
ncbi:hypothetical protein HKX48_004319 [Thoreauomyces humboldtii]|nr:hypothetical protein HKX48_004319 [Thoreauomyces humboldtii]